MGGTHVISVLATGGTNESPKKASANITYSAPSSAPKFGAPGAANVLTSSALLLGEIELSGASSNTVDFVWDTSDQGTSNISDWNGSALAVGTGKEGFYGKQISDLGINTTYYYRNRATMALGPLDITNSLRLLTLPNEVLKLIEQKKISSGHAKILVGLDNASFIASKIVDKKLSVRQSENFVKIFKKKKGSKIFSKDPNLRNLEESIQQKIGLIVNIKSTKKNKGSITFNFADLDQLNKIISIIKSNY